MKLVKAANILARETHLIGYVETSYSILVKMFGPPLNVDGDKVRVEWILKPANEDVPITIYDWKEYDVPVEKVKCWHIGGKSPLAVQLLQEVLPQARLA